MPVTSITMKAAQGHCTQILIISTARNLIFVTPTATGALVNPCSTPSRTFPIGPNHALSCLYQ